MGTLANNELFLVISWSIYLFTAVQITAHLFKEMNILIASQSIIALISSLFDIKFIDAGLSHYQSLFLSITVGIVISLLQLPLLLKTGTHIFLLITIISHILLSEIWLALPNFTGGSAGILISHSHTFFYSFSMILVTVVFFFVYNQIYIKPKVNIFKWECLKTMGSKAGSFGIPAVRLYTIGLILFGLTFSVIGITTTRQLGYLSLSSYSLSWTLTILMIALIESKKVILVRIVLVFFYVILRIIVRFNTDASITQSNIIELFFPFFIYIYISLKQKILIFDK